jgi:hypothetical protein
VKAKFIPHFVDLHIKHFSALTEITEKVGNLREKRNRE